MSEENKNGQGQAYPSNWGPGVTVRDYFAAKALQGDWANAEAGVFSNSATVEELQQRCELYYRTADAMLRAREVKP